MNGNDILPFLEPIYRFCYHRLSNRYDAEDLASEIVCHVLDGMSKYEIRSLEGWIWRIARNRYARFLERRRRDREVLSEDELFDPENDYCQPEEDTFEEKYEELFRSLHTLSAEYRNIFVDHYLREMPIRALAQKYALPETTIKWRLNAGRQKIRERIGDINMEKIYHRINWNTTTCNGCMDSDQYLHTQLARAICLAAYEKPVTVEEISLATGIPALYVEDALPHLLYGDAIEKIGNKYATEFIVYRLADRAVAERDTGALVKKLADKLEEILWRGEATDLPCGMERFGYVLIPRLLRGKIYEIRNDRLKLTRGPFPPRQDGGYGWFIVEETVDGEENLSEYNTGCNEAVGEGGTGYYHWIAKYMDSGVYHNGGLRWLCEEKGIPQTYGNGTIPAEVFTEEEAAHLIAANLLTKQEGGYRLCFPCLTRAEFDAILKAYVMEDAEIDRLLAEYLLAGRRAFEGFVPKRLHGQINQYLGYWSYQLVGQVTDELIRRGCLARPDADKPHTDGVLFVKSEATAP